MSQVSTKVSVLEIYLIQQTQRGIKGRSIENQKNVGKPKRKGGGGGQGRNQHNNARVRTTTKTTKEEGPAPIVIKYISRLRVEQTTDTL